MNFKKLTATAYRATSYDTPFWVSPNRRSGRWASVEDRVCTQYCSLDPAAPVAEFLRGERVTDWAVAREIRISLWELRVDESAILDLSTPEAAGSCGVRWADLIDDGWTGCRAIARAVRDQGGRGIVSPSAALPGSLSLTLFGPRSEFRWTMKPVLAIQVPARRFLHGQPGDALLDAVRHLGDEYPNTPVSDHLMAILE